MLGRMYDAIEYRGSSQTGVETLPRYAGVPVFNGLTDEYHPTQMLADVMTMREHSDKPLEDRYAFMGDTRNNMGHSLMIVGCLMGMDVRICGPKKLWPADEYVAIARELEKKHGAPADHHRRPEEGGQGRGLHPHRRLGVDGRAQGGVEGAHQAAAALPGQCQADEGERQCAGQVHAPPAGLPRHRDDARQAARRDHGIDNGLKVTDDVFESEWNIAFEQAENRLHTIKAIPSRRSGLRCWSSSPWAATRCCVAASR